MEETIYHTIVFKDGEKFKLPIEIKIPGQKDSHTYEAMKFIIKGEMNALAYALWMARAERARAEAKGWYHSSDGIVHFDATFNIYGRLQASGKIMVRRPAEWERLWVVVENKCREYAQKFKEVM